MKDVPPPRRRTSTGDLRLEQCISPLHLLRAVLLNRSLGLGPLRFDLPERLAGLVQRLFGGYEVLVFLVAEVGLPAGDRQGGGRGRREVREGDVAAVRVSGPSLARSCGRTLWKRTRILSTRHL